MKAAEEQRQREEEEEKRQAAEKKKEEKRLERKVRCISYFMDVHKDMSQNRGSGCLPWVTLGDM